MRSSRSWADLTDSQNIGRIPYLFLLSYRYTPHLTRPFLTEKMPPHLWTTPTQYNFLTGKRPEYVTAKAKENGTTAFFNDLFEEFFKLWPEQSTETDEFAALPVTLNKKKKPKKKAIIKIYETHKEWREYRRRVIILSVSPCILLIRVT